MTLAALAVFFLCLALSLRAVRWAGKPRVRVVRNDGALSWLDAKDMAHRRPYPNSDVRYAADAHKP